MWKAKMIRWSVVREFTQSDGEITKVLSVHSRPSDPVKIINKEIHTKVKNISTNLGLATQKVT